MKPGVAAAVALTSDDEDEFLLVFPLQKCPLLLFAFAFTFKAAVIEAFNADPVAVELFTTFVAVYELFIDGFCPDIAATAVYEAAPDEEVD